MLGDYHAQYDDGAFLDALRVTRTRQARQLVERLRRRVPRLSGVVDYGAGRGWFLSACREAGVAPVAGVDASRIAVDGLEAEGVEARLVEEGEEGPDVLSQLSFRPRVVTLLDVVEHFPFDALGRRFRRIVAACGPELELVVMKVPVAGLLYGGAVTLGRLGASGFLLQLYQAGTWPPHFHYFSRASAERLFRESGLSVVDRAWDLDFEPRALGARLGAAGPGGRALARVAGEALRVLAGATRRYDSLVLLGTPTPRV